MSVHPGKTPAWTGGTHGGTLSVLDHIMGQVDPHNPPIGPLVVVNPAESPPTGWGAENVQQFQSGHTNNLRTNQSAEQGHGVGPERRWPHYPHATNPNAFRNTNIFQRSGGDSYSTNVYRPEIVAYWAQALRHEQSQQPVKFTSPVTPVVNQAPSIPFVASVPAYGPGGY